jgi:hypothetical protein
MVFEAVNRGQMSQMRAAEYLDISVGKLEETFSNAGLVLKDESNLEITLM